MEVVTSAWVIFMIYCTQLLGFKQCVAVPIPTLNYYSGGSPKINSYIKLRQSRDPEIYHDNFVFPNRDSSKPLILDEPESHPPNKRFDTGKIYFPDDIAETKDRTYHFSSQGEPPRPGGIPHRRPSSAIRNSHNKFTVLGNTRSPIHSEDGSPQVSQNNRKQLPQISNLQRTRPGHHPPRPMSLVKLTDKELVAAAIQGYYEWLQQQQANNGVIAPSALTEDKKMTQEGTHPPPPHSGDNSKERIKNTAAVGEHSLVSSLKQQSCPDGQVRASDGRCKTKVEY